MTLFLLWLLCYPIGWIVARGLLRNMGGAIMKKPVLPKSKAKTAYGLLSEVRKLILEEPKRYQQATWVERKASKRSKPPQGFPACGTVGCVAGWVATLKRESFRPIDTGRIATEILGLDDFQAEQLFDAGALYDVITTDVCPSPQTPEYAALGAKHITNFQRKHEAQLKATRV